MLFATIGQGALFVWMMAAGAAVGAWYLVCALLRRFVQAGFWLTLACDLLFGVGSAVILLAALVAGNYGQLRLFEILGVALGALVFALGFAPPLKILGQSFQKAMAQIKATVAKNRLIKVLFK